MERKLRVQYEGAICHVTFRGNARRGIFVDDRDRDLEITKEGDTVVVSFSYTREIHLVGPAFLLLKYTGRSK